MLLERYLKKQLEALPEELRAALLEQSILFELADLKTLIYSSTCFFQTGAPVMSQFFALQDQTLATKERVLQVAASLASKTSSPFLGAITQAAHIAQLPIREIEVDALTNSGILGKMDRTWYVLGDEQMMIEEGIELGVSSRAIIQQLEIAGKRIVFLAQKQPKRILAIFACDKEVEIEIVEAVAHLERLGLEQILLTGEKTRVAKGIMAKLDMHLLHTELKLEEKQQIIRSLVQKQPASGILCNTATNPFTNEGGLLIILGEQCKSQMNRLEITSLSQLPLLIEASRKIMQKARSRFFWQTI